MVFGSLRRSNGSRGAGGWLNLAVLTATRFLLVGETMLEIIAKYESHRFTFGETLIASARVLADSQQVVEKHGADPAHALTIRGYASEQDFTQGQAYRLLGNFTDYTNKRTRQTEKQFSFKSFTEHIPPTKEGLTSYLASHGRGYGVGPSKAQRLVTEFGIEEVLHICRTSPSEVARVAKINLELAEGFSNLLTEKAQTENTSIEVDSLLAGNGFPKTLIRRVIKEWGADAPKKIKDDPYCLMAFRGVGFRLADKLYLSLGYDPANIRRQAFAIQWIIESDSSGNTWFAATEVATKLASVIGSTVDFVAAVKHARDVHMPPLVSTLRTNSNGSIEDSNAGQLWIASYNESANESELSDLVVAALDESRDQLITIWEDMETSMSIPVRVIQCTRCGRALTSEEVYVVDGKPYGPTCVEKI